MPEPSEQLLPQISDSDRIRLQSWLWEQHEESTLDLHNCILEIDGTLCKLNATLGLSIATDEDLDEYQPLDPPEWLSEVVTYG